MEAILRLAVKDGSFMRSANIVCCRVVSTRKHILRFRLNGPSLQGVLPSVDTLQWAPSTFSHSRELLLSTCIAADDAQLPSRHEIRLESRSLLRSSDRISSSCDVLLITPIFTPARGAATTSHDQFLTLDDFLRSNFKFLANREPINPTS